MKKKVKLFSNNKHCQNCKCCFISTSCGECKGSIEIYQVLNLDDVVAVCAYGHIKYKSGKSFRCEGCNHVSEDEWTT